MIHFPTFFSHKNLQSIFSDWRKWQRSNRHLRQTLQQYHRLFDLLQWRYTGGITERFGPSYACSRSVSSNPSSRCYSLCSFHRKRSASTADVTSVSPVCSSSDFLAEHTLATALMLAMPTTWLQNESAPHCVASCTTTSMSAYKPPEWDTAHMRTPGPLCDFWSWNSKMGTRLEKLISHTSDKFQSNFRMH